MLTPEIAASSKGKLVEAVRQPFTIAGHTVSATASIGIAIYPIDGKDAVSVHAHADAALYRAKNNGRNGFSF